MAFAYSYDLRIRALNLVASGKTTEEVSSLLNISISTIRLWLRLKNNNIDIRPKKNWQNGYGHKIKNLEDFSKFVDENNDLTLEEMAEKWGGVKRMTIHRALQKIGYSKKKDLWVR
jgi:transposase